MVVQFSGFCTITLNNGVDDEYSICPQSIADFAIIRL